MNRTPETGIEITRATPRDKEAVRKVCEACYEDDYILRMGETFLTTGTVLLAQADDEPVGLVRLTVAMDGSSWLSALRVVPSRRREGVGAALCRTCEDVARENRSTAIRLWTEETNEAAYSLFLALGYSRVGVFTRWWTEDLTRDLPLPRRAESVGEVWSKVLEAEVYRASAGYAPIAMRFSRMSEPLLEELAESERLYVDARGAPCVLDRRVWKSFGAEIVELTALGDDIAAQVQAAMGFGSTDSNAVGTFLPAGEPWSQKAERAGLEEGTWGNRGVLCEKSIQGEESRSLV